MDATRTPAPAQGEKTPVKLKKPHWKTVAAQQAKAVPALPPLPPPAKVDYSHKVEPVRAGHKSFAKHRFTLIITVKGKVKKWALDHEKVDPKELAWYVAQSR